MKKIYILVALAGVLAIGAYVYMSQKSAMQTAGNTNPAPATPVAAAPANPAPAAAPTPAATLVAKPAAVPAAQAARDKKKRIVISDITVQSSAPGSKRETLTRLPYSKKDAKKQERLDFVFTVTRPTEEKSLLRIIPDDCVETLEVNDLPVKLDKIMNMKKRCDYNKGFIIDLKNYYHLGANKIHLVIINQGGPSGVRVGFYDAPAK